MASTKHIHFIGIGGIGMSALARFWHHEGAVVTGSDRERGLVTEGLEALGIVIDYEQKAKHLSKGSDPLLKNTYIISGSDPEIHYYLILRRKLLVVPICP